VHSAIGGGPDALRERARRLDVLQRDLYTMNPADFAGLEEFLTVIPLPEADP